MTIRGRSDSYTSADGSIRRRLFLPLPLRAWVAKRTKDAGRGPSVPDLGSEGDGTRLRFCSRGNPSRRPLPHGRAEHATLGPIQSPKLPSRGGFPRRAMRHRAPATCTRQVEGNQPDVAMLLLIPGPVTTRPEVRAALAQDFAPWDND